jgi:putative hydrolase of the HAD superfamily
LEYIYPELLQAIPKEKFTIALSKANEYLPDEIYLNEAEELERFQNFYRTISEMLPELHFSRQQADSVAYDRVKNDANFILFEDTIKTLEYLKSTYKLGIISDTDPSIKRVLKSLGIDDYFDTMTFSFEVGACKPSRKMYEHALETMGLPANETVFIDDIEKNLDGAASFGIQPIMTLSKPNAEASTAYQNIRKLSDLLLLL